MQSQVDYQIQKMKILIMKTPDRKYLPWFEPVFVTAYLLLVATICLLESEGFTSRAILESIHQLKPVVGLSFIVFAYLLSPLRYWIFLSSFVIFLFGMRYLIYETLSDHASTDLIWAAWMDTKWFLLIVLPLGIIVTSLKLFGIFKQSPLDE